MPRQSLCYRDCPMQRTGQARRVPRSLPAIALPAPFTIPASQTAFLRSYDGCLDYFEGQARVLRIVITYEQGSTSDALTSLGAADDGSQSTLMSTVRINGCPVIGLKGQRKGSSGSVGAPVYVRLTPTEGVSGSIHATVGWPSPAISHGELQGAWLPLFSGQ